MSQEKPKKPVRGKKEKKLHLNTSFQEALQMFADAANGRLPEHLKAKLPKK